MALQSPNKLMEQAKSILDGNPGLINSEFLRDPVFNERNDVAEEAKDHPRERRPALGLKCARFSLKPNKIHPTEILKPTLDIDNLKDPEEFFMAYGRLENVKIEIQKQLGGVSFEPNQNNTSTNARQRQPGLLGSNQQRSARYKHRYSMETSDSNDHVPSSQEIFESTSLGFVGESTDKTAAGLASLESEPTVRKTISAEDTIRNCASTAGKSKEDNSKELGFDTNIGSNKSHVDFDVDIGCSDMDNSVSRPNCVANCPCDFEDKAHEENMQDAVAFVPRDDPDLDLVNVNPLGENQSFQGVS